MDIVKRLRSGRKRPATILEMEAADDIERLRAIIEDAPHEETCLAHNSEDGQAGCNCWKQAALRGEDDT